VARALFLSLVFIFSLTAQQKSSTPAPPVAAEQEPPEEDPDLIPREYSFNPLEAGRNITAGNFYFKKGNYRAAAKRYVEAAKWDPTSAEATLKLAETDERLHDFAGARAAYSKYLELAPDAKNADEIRKKIAKVPAASAAKKKK
jgi:tetratricopeptide (TPR) repeat protein